MINFSGQGLQRKYGKKDQDDPDLSKNVKNKDHEALRKASRGKREAREKRMAIREDNNLSPDKKLEQLKKNPMKDINVIDIVSKAKEKTGVIAREYNLPEPKNPEALAHDRKHCYHCDRRLDSPNVVKQNGLASDLFEEEEIRLLCCWCFGNMGDSDIKLTMRSGIDASKEIRLKVYNPEESSKAEIEQLVSSKIIQMKVKLKKWKQDVSLVGKVKHDYLYEGDQFENQVMYRAKTRYNACTL
jgi:hypothetical protein